MLTLAAEATHDPTSIALAVGIVIFVIGVLGIVIPVLPGLLLCVAAVLVWAGSTGGTTAWVTFGVVAAIYAAASTMRDVHDEVDEADPTTWGNPSRNDPCPCGSGERFKNCHGRLV